MPSELHPEPASDASVLTNVEAGSLDKSLEWDKRLLYEVSCDVSNGTFEIVRDYRIANGICSSGGSGGGGSGGGGACDISAYYKEYDEQGNRNNKIATWTNGKEGAAAKTVDIYAPAGGGGGGGGGGEPQGAFRWGDIEQREGSETKYGTIKYCNFQFGRKHYTPSQESWVMPVKDCTFYLYVLHNNPGGSMIVTSDYGNTLTSTTIPLFSIDAEGKVTNDFRGMPVIPVWSTAQG